MWTIAKLQCSRVKWMNPRASTNEAYVPTYIEHVANVITHGIWVVPSLLGGLELVKRSSTWTQLVSAWVYGTSLLLVFAVSTFFHSVHYCNHTYVLLIYHIHKHFPVWQYKYLYKIPCRRLFKFNVPICSKLH